MKLLLIPEHDTALIDAIEHLVASDHVHCALKAVGTPEELRAALAAEKFDAVVAEYRPGSPMTDALGGIDGVPLIVLCASADLERAVRETRSKASQYLVRDERNAYIRLLLPTLESLLAASDFGQLSNIIEQTADSILITDRNGVIEYVNPGFEKMTGFSREEALGKTPRILKSDKQDKEFYQVLWNKVLAGEVFNTVFINKRKNGDIYYQEETITPIKDETGAVARFVSTGRDISENKRMEEALQEANEKLIMWVNELEQRGSEIFLLSEMADLLQTCSSPDEAFAVIAESMKKLFQNDSGALCLVNDPGTGVDVVASWGDVSALSHAFLPTECWALRRSKIHVAEDTHTGLQCRHVNPSFNGSYLCVPMMAQGERLGILYLQGNPRELQQPQEVRKLIVEAKQRLAMTVAEHIALSLANIKLRETLRYQAIRDPLTNLFNRRYLEDTLEREIHQAKRSNSQIGIIMLDIDHFKKFNDTFGHAAGDALLTSLGDFLKTNVRAGDIPCRYGGEEFILILLGAPLGETAKRAEVMRDKVKSLIVKYGDQTLRSITLSLGVACYPEHGTSVAEVLRCADTALYKAKAEGRDRVVVFAKTAP